MNTLKSLFLTALIVAFSMNVSFAGVGKSAKKAAKAEAAATTNITTQVAQQIGVPVLNITEKEQTRVMLSFSVNANNELAIEQVISQYPEITEYLNETLNGFQLKDTGANHVGQTYAMKLSVDIQ